MQTLHEFETKTVDKILDTILGTSKDGILPELHRRLQARLEFWARLTEFESYKNIALKRAINLRVSI